MRQKIENPPTKKRILDSAQTIMMTKGYAGTSVDEVCAKAKVTKGNFFYYFKTKENLGQELVECFGSNMKDGFCCAADGGGKDPLERIYACLDFMAEQAAKPDFHGCLIGTFSQEAEAIGPRLRLLCGKSFEQGAEFFRQAFEKAMKKYPPKTPVDPKALADFFLSGVQGSFILMKAKEDPKVVRSNLKLMRAYLRSIFGR